MEQAASGGRVPPHHLEAERSVLGAMLQSSEAVMLAQESLTPDDFYDPAHREIFDAMTHLASMSRPVDLVTLDEERKAAMVSNLLVVLCGNRDAQPIVNSGSLY